MGSIPKWRIMQVVQMSKEKGKAFFVEENVKKELAGAELSQAQD